MLFDGIEFKVNLTFDTLQMFIFSFNVSLTPKNITIVVSISVFNKIGKKHKGT